MLVMVMIIVTACQKTLRQHKIYEKEQKVKVSVSDLDRRLRFGYGYNWAWTNELFKQKVFGLLLFEGTFTSFF
jgi:hypothetical protein